MKKDLQAWSLFPANFNGTWMWLEEQWTHSPNLHLFTDASGSIGFGAVFGNDWFAGLWPEPWKNYNIVTLELFPIVLAMEMFGHSVSTKRIVFHTDQRWGNCNL